MRLMVRVEGHWLVAVADWHPTLCNLWLRHGLKKQGFKTKLLAQREYEGAQHG